MSNNCEVIVKNKRLCSQCDDGSGGCIYPYYGLAPHTHENSESFIDSTVFAGEHPKNFKLEDGNCGTYTHCLNCGSHD